MGLSRERREEIRRASGDVFFDPERELEHRRRVRQRSAVGCLLYEVPWEYFVTLTSRWEWSAATWRRQFERWHCWLEERTQGRVDYFWVRETGERGRLHGHSLVRGDGEYLKFHMRDAWLWGRVDISAYTPLRDAAFYVAKTVGDPTTDWHPHIHSKYIREATLDRLRRRTPL